MFRIDNPNIIATVMTRVRWWDLSFGLEQGWFLGDVHLFVKYWLQYDVEQNSVQTWKMEKWCFIYEIVLTFCEICKCFEITRTIYSNSKRSNWKRFLRFKNLLIVEIIVESFYSVKYGLSIITSNVRQIISVMKTKTLVFPEKWCFKNN